MIANTAANHAPMMIFTGVFLIGTMIGLLVMMMRIRRTIG